MVDDIETRLVELASCVVLRDCETDSIGETLAEGTSGDLNTVSVVGFWVTRCKTVYRLKSMY
jgi:hypothetical protein